MEPNDRKFEKGFFTRNRFAVAAKYQMPASRKRLFMYGALGALVLAIVFLADAFAGRASTIASGPLSDSHAMFAKDCSTCHTPARGVTDEKCSTCHQKSGQAALYSADRHYEYHSGNLDRTPEGGKERTCASCHREHQGRQNQLQAVADRKCTSCHETGSFRKKHPEFEFASKKIADPANLKFTHAKHVRELMEEREITDAEATCLTCHEAQPDGRTFKPISFERSCNGCHLGTSAETPPLPLRSGGGPGVSTLGEIRASGTAASRWSHYWNPNDFSDMGGIVKSPVYHADPWILHNLQRLRREMFPGSELADLLSTSPERSPREARAIHREALNTLRDQLEALKGSPSTDVQREVQALTALLGELEERLEKPYAPFDETKFAVGAKNAAAGVNMAAYNEVVNNLTEPCQECHLVQNATIKRVQKNQTALVRAEFNHKAHVIHARCLDCHTAIPIRKALESDDDLPEQQDNAEIVNIPTIATCRSCHTSKGAPNSCTSCHLYHPDKSHFSELTR